MNTTENTLKAAVVVSKAFGQTDSQLHLTLKKTLIAKGIDPYPILPTVVFSEPTLTTSELAEAYEVSVNALNDYLLNNLLLSEIKVSDNKVLLTVPPEQSSFGFNGADGEPRWYKSTSSEMMADLCKSYYSY